MLMNRSEKEDREQNSHGRYMDDGESQTKSLETTPSENLYNYLEIV